MPKLNIMRINSVKFRRMPLLAVSIAVTLLCSLQTAASNAAQVIKPVRHVWTADNGISNDGNLPVPDFAYPVEVADSMTDVLNRAIVDRNGRQMVEALVGLGIAKTLIAPDSVIPFIQKVDAIRLQEKDRTIRSLLALLEATAIKDYYEANQWELNQRTTESEPSEDMTLWSGDQFGDKVAELAIEASSSRDELRRQPISQWKGIVNYDDVGAIFYPTLWEFTCANACSLLFSMWNDQTNKAMDAIISDWVGSYSNPGAPKVASLLAKLKYFYDLTGNQKENVRRYYAENQSTPYAIELLLGENAATYQQLVVFQDKYPDYIRLNAVKNALAELTAPRLTILSTGLAALNREFSIDLEITNARTLKINVYRLPDSATYTHEVKNKASLGLPVQTFDIVIDKEIPYNDLKKSISCSLDKYGRYVIIPVIDGKEQDYRFAEALTCSDMAIIGGVTDGVGFVVESFTGKPLSKVDIIPQGLKNLKLKKMRSDESGRFEIVLPKDKSANGRGMRVTPKKGKDAYSSGGTITWNYDYSQNDVTTCNANIQTSLPVYHPGDTVEFMAVVYSPDYGRSGLMNNRRVNVMMCDANNQFVDTLSLTTDRMGRITGKFAIPKSGLTGYYSLLVKKLADDGDIRLNSTARFMVSDYKLPTFKVVVDSLQQAGDEYVFTGSAETYSGFPVSDADVTLRLGLQQPFYYRYTPGQGENVKEVDLRTDKDGRWRWAWPVDSLSAVVTPMKNILIVDARVTDAAGETQSGYMVSPLGRAYQIVQSISGKSINAATTKRFALGVKNSLNQDVEAKLQLRFVRDDSTVNEMEVISKNGIAEVDLTKVSSGTYSIEAVLDMPDSDRVEEKIEDVVIYRPDDKSSPSLNPLWIPTTSFKVKSGTRQLNLIYATLNDNVNVLATVSSNGELLKQWWMPCVGGMQELAIDIPEGVSQMTLSFNGVYKCRGFNKTVSISVENPDDALDLKIENLRDKTTPLTTETITLTIANGDGTPKAASALLDIYSKAIEMIEQPNLSWRFSKYGSSKEFRLYANVPNLLRESYSVNPVLLTVEPIDAPSLNLYGLSFSGRRNIFIRGMAKQSVADYNASFMSLDEAMPTMAEAAGAFDADEGTADFETSKSSNGDIESDTIDFREAEIPLTLFSPMLSTEDGKIEVSFVWPNSNTRWVVRALAYDRDLAYASATAEVVASKPVMISANPPRFLRYGDEAYIPATVMNNTDSIAVASVKIELLDPMTMTAVGEPFERELTIQPMGSVSETVKLNVPDNLQYVILRSSATAGNYTDAEQQIIPLLEATQPIIEAETFYLAPDDERFSMDVSDDSETEEKVLTFTANPTWEVLTSLPGIRESDPSTSTAAIANIFSTAVANGLITKNKDVTKALNEWLNSHSDDEAMLSKLNRNPQLKQMLLDATPWVQAAASDVERMTRLSLLFDEPTVEKSLAKAVDDLRKFRDEESGGFRWCTISKEPSAWATENVLLGIGRLSQLGYLSKDDFRDEINGALKYLDKIVSRDVERSADFYDVDFAWICSFFPEYTPTAKADEANRRALAELRGGWKKLSLDDKALAASLLWREGDKQTPADILKSLDQYSTYTPQSGRCWQSLSSGYLPTPLVSTAQILNAYSEIKPDAPQVDQIRQWLVMNKISQGWGTTAAASDVIAAILSSGSQWLTIPDSLEIMVGGHPLQLSETDRLTGSFIAKLPEAGGSLEINRVAGVPAWGATLSKSIKAMRTVKAHSTQDLKVEKQMLVNRNGKWVESTDFKVGDVVKVRLLIKANRRIDYVTVIDNRPATFEPVIQTPRTVFSGSFGFYLENRDSATNLFVESLPKGIYIVEYEMNVTTAGEFSSGVATLQSQYAPEMTAHSAGNVIKVKENGR